MPVSGRQDAGPTKTTAKHREIIIVEGRELSVSNLAKVYYPETGFTKGQAIDYYMRIGPVLLPHLKDRPLTLKRYPEGVTGLHFFEKRCPSHRPGWIRTTNVWSEGSQEYIGFCVANDLPSLAWTANLGAIELHTSLSRSQDVSCPTCMAFDLDPGPPANIVLCCKVALLLRELFNWMELESFPKTSGSKGLQLYVPLNTPGLNYDVTKTLARAIAQLLEREHPDIILSNMRKSLRTGKIFIDWSQNDEHKTTINVYSMRAKEQPTVSTPVTWDEVTACADGGDADMLKFETHQVLERVGKMGDLFAPVETMKQKISASLLSHLGVRK